MTTDLLWMALAGVGAGFINTVVGSGSLITFPTLVALGLPPVSANISNNLGLIFGGISGTWGYREELRSAGPVVRRLLPASAIGALVGALSLLRWPDLFGRIVPLLVGIAVVLVLIQPRVRAALEGRTATRGGLWIGAGVLLTGIYGGYFGAAQGVLLLGVLGLLLPHDLQQLNAVKNALALAVNVVAALVFAVVAPGQIDLRAAAAVAVGAVLGGFLGARVGRKLSPALLRGAVVLIGCVALYTLI